MYSEVTDLPLSREFRPKRVEDYIGNEKMVESFLTSVRKKKLPQVVMIEGETGCGKTTFARIMTKPYQCENPTEDGACGVCQTCLDIDNYIETGIAPQGIYEIDSSIDDNKSAVDSLLENATIPDFTKYKIFIIDEFQEVKPNAQSRFLKLIEEPPPHLVFIFCTTNIERILPTIRNRCLETYRVTKPNINKLVKRLKQICELKDIPYEKDGLYLIAKKSNQIIRDAINALDKVVKQQGYVSEDAVKECLDVISTKDFMYFVECIRKKNTQLFIKKVSEIDNHSTYMNSFLEYCKNGLYVINNVGKTDSFTKDELKEYSEVFKDMSLQEFFVLFNNLIEVQSKNVSPEIRMILFGMKMMGINDDLTKEGVDVDRADVLSEEYNANQEYVKRQQSEKKKAQPEDLSRIADIDDVMRMFNAKEVGDKN